MAIERTEPMKIDASVIVGALRHEWAKTKSQKEVLALGWTIMPTATEEQILNIATGKATLRGCTPDPITYVEPDPDIKE
jgi:hypothetical protein